MADAAPPPHPTDPPSPQPTGWIAATCILGAAVLGLTATVVIRGASSDAVGESAEGSAAAACALVEQVADDASDARIDMARLNTAGSIGMLAAAQDNSYRELSDAIIEPVRVSSATFDYDSPKVGAAIDAARDLCADEGF